MTSTIGDFLDFNGKVVVFLAGDVIHPLGYRAMLLILSGVALLQYGSRRRLVSKG